VTDHSMWLVDRHLDQTLGVFAQHDAPAECLADEGDHHHDGQGQGAESEGQCVREGQPACELDGVVGDPAATGKSSSSDVRAGKRSAPIVRALRSNSEAGRRLADLFADSPPEDDDAVVMATRLIVDAGGVDWAAGEADARVARARRRLDGLVLADRDAATDLATVAEFIVSRGRLINASRR